MDNQREELPRIAVDTLHDWQRVKASYTNAAVAEFEKRTASRTPAERDALRIHLHKVRVCLLAGTRPCPIPSHDLTRLAFQMIERTFEMCKPNLRINGKNFEDLNEDEEGSFPPSTSNGPVSSLTGVQGLNLSMKALTGISGP